MIQAPRKSNGIELSYQQYAYDDRDAYAADFEAEHDLLSGVREAYEVELALPRHPTHAPRARHEEPAPSDPPSQDAVRELARLHAQLRQVREWADRAEWRETGSDGLYAILTESGIRER